MRKRSGAARAAVVLSLIVNLCVQSVPAQPGVTTRPLTTWRGYIAAFASATEIPVLNAHGVRLDSDERIDAFVHALDRTFLAPQALFEAPTVQDQSALLSKALDDHAQRLLLEMERLPRDSQKEYPRSLHAQQRQYEDLSLLKELLPEATRRQVQEAHREIIAKIGRWEEQDSREIEDRLKEIKALWDDKADKERPLPFPEPITEPSAPNRLAAPRPRQGNGLLTAASRFLRLRTRYKIARTSTGWRLLFDEPAGVVHVTVASLSHALLLVGAYEDANPESVRQWAFPLPDVRHVRFNPKMPITFGLEYEVNLRENSNIVMDYRVPSIPEKEWVRLSIKDREDHVDAILDKTGKGKVVMVKLSRTPKDMAPNLVRDAQRQFEMRGMVFVPYSDVERFVRRLRERYGVGSIQGWVAFKNHRGVEGAAGYALFEADYAQLSALEHSYKKYLGEPGYIPGKSLIHDNLKVLTEKDRLHLIQSEIRARRGEFFNGKLHVFAPILRIVQEALLFGIRILGFELRQFHKRLDALLREMGRLSAHFQFSGDLRAFRPFEEILLPAGASEREIRLMLAARDGEGLLDASLWSWALPSPQTSFLLPLRDWIGHPATQALDRPTRSDLKRRHVQATMSYIDTVNALLLDRENRIDKDSLQDKLQIAVARWAYEARLSPAFDAFRSQAMIGPGATPPTLERLPFVRSVATVPHSPRSLRVPAVRDLESPEYLRFLDSSVEIIYSGITNAGNISLRVGRRIYYLYGVRKTLSMRFDPRQLSKKHVGFAFRADPQKIRGAYPELESFYRNAQDNNVPPFDFYGAQLEIVREPDGSLKYRHPWANLKDNAIINARLRKQKDGLYLQTPDGFKYPVIEMNGRYYIQGLSCARAAIENLQKHFGILTLETPSAKALKNSLLKDNPGGRAPDAVIRY